MKVRICEVRGRFSAGEIVEESFAVAKRIAIARELFAGIQDIAFARSFPKHPIARYSFEDYTTLMRDGGPSDA